MLTKSFQKHQKYLCKKLVKVNKVSTFAPATATDVHRNTGKKRNQNEKKFSNKNSKKLARMENGYYICTPQNTGSSLKDWKEKEVKTKRNFLKKTSKNSCHLEISFLLLHPL